MCFYVNLRMRKINFACNTRPMKETRYNFANYVLYRRWEKYASVTRRKQARQASNKTGQLCNQLQEKTLSKQLDRKTVRSQSDYRCEKAGKPSNFLIIRTAYRERKGRQSMKLINTVQTNGTVTCGSTCYTTAMD